MSLHIGHLPPKTNSRILHDLFAPFGPLERCDAVSQGYGFVAFFDPVDAIRAKTTLDGTVLNGNIITISPSFGFLIVKQLLFSRLDKGGQVLRLLLRVTVVVVRSRLLTGWNQHEAMRSSLLAMRTIRPRGHPMPLALAGTPFSIIDAYSAILITILIWNPWSPITGGYIREKSFIYLSGN